jgi:hypothetical protein
MTAGESDAEKTLSSWAPMKVGTDEKRPSRVE